MGWRFHKSINLGGGARMNISKSGIGYSFGGKGFRVAFLPDGRIRQTITIPGTGLSYIDEIGSPQTQPSENGVYQSWTGHAITSSTDETSRIFEQTCKDYFHAKHRWMLLLCLAIAAFVAIPLLLILADIDNLWVILLLSASYIALCFGLVKLSKTAPSPIQIDYDIQNMPEAYKNIVRGFETLGTCSKLYHVPGAHVGVRSRTHAGSSTTLNMEDVKFTYTPLSFIKTNVKCFHLKSKGQNLYILPDRALIKQGKNPYHVIDIRELSITYKPGNVNWHGSIPKDTKTVGYTWQYVNNDGSPDRRFKENYQVPICRFGVLDLRCLQGLHLVLYGSNEEKTKTAYELISNKVRR